MTKVTAVLHQLGFTVQNGGDYAFLLGVKKRNGRIATILVEAEGKITISFRLWKFARDLWFERGMKTVKPPDEKVYLAHEYVKVPLDSLTKEISVVHSLDYKKIIPELKEEVMFFGYAEDDNQVLRVAKKYDHPCISSSANNKRTIGSIIRKRLANFLKHRQGVRGKFTATFPCSELEAIEVLGKVARPEETSTSWRILLSNREAFDHLCGAKWDIHVFPDAWFTMVTSLTISHTKGSPAFNFTFQFAIPRLSISPLYREKTSKYFHF